MTYKEKDIWAMFNELNSMLYEVMGDFNKAWAENIELKKEVAWFKKYTDALVEHKDMVCLPADLKNLRESNAALATENQELKKQVDTLNEVITQAWFTDVEEKDKQIEYLLQKVKELSDPELKDDEDVTKTFMDAQTNPKDIEFDGDKLVDSVEEAASKLKSIKEHNNLFTKEISFSTGIACPKCGSELMYVDQNLLLSNPPQRRVQCSKCNHIDYILV
jgi:DNA-directed RNA polymerase subunit M/transcription elongation factor TFIIS